MAHPNRAVTPTALPRSPLSPCPLLPTQLCALLRGGRLLIVGFVRHGAGDAAFASALTVGGFATFGGDGFFLIIVFPRRVVVLVPTKSGREKKNVVGLVGFLGQAIISLHVLGDGFFFCWSFGGGRSAFFFCTRRLFSWLGASWIGGGVICGGVFFLQLAAAPPPSARRDLTETGLIPDHSNSSLPPPHLSS